jgi:transcription elongation factor
MTAIEPGDRVRVVRGAHRKGAEGVVLKVNGDWAEVQEDGAKFSTIDPDLADLELIAKGAGEAPAAGYAVGWGT